VLFAAETVSDARLAGLLALASLLGGAAKWVADLVIDRVNKSRDRAAAGEKTITDHLERAVARLEAECQAHEERVERLRERVNQLAVRSARMAGHIRYLEALLNRAKADYVPWAEESDPTEPGGGPHPPLPEDGRKP